MGLTRGAAAVLEGQMAGRTRRKEQLPTMPGFDITAPHGLGQEQAVDRLKGFVAKIGQRFPDQVSNLQERWTDNVLDFSFTTYGFTIKGAATVGPDQVRLKGDLPLAALMFKGKIEQSIRDEVGKVLG
jgi:hypothetical protein